MDHLSRTPRQPGVTASAVGSSHSSITIGLRWLRLCGNCILAQSSNHDSNGALLPGRLLEPRRVPRHMHEEKEKKGFSPPLWVSPGEEDVKRGLTQEPLSRSVVCLRRYGRSKRCLVMDSGVEKILAGRLAHTAYLSDVYQSVSGSTLSGKTNVPSLILPSFEFASPPLRLTTHAVIQTMVLVPGPELPLQLPGTHFFPSAPTVARHHENPFCVVKITYAISNANLYIPNLNI